MKTKKWRHIVSGIMAAAMVIMSAGVLPADELAPEEAETGEPAPAVWTRYPVPLDDELQIYIEQLCAEYEVPANVVFAVIEVESGYDPSLVGDGGNSWGLMQIYATQHTARCVRLGAWNLLDPKANVRVGIDFLGELLAIHTHNQKQRHNVNQKGESIVFQIGVTPYFSYASGFSTPT